MSESNPKTGHDTRGRILDAAEVLFMEHGFDGTSMRMITSRAAVNLAAVNYHFGSKESLMQEVFRRRLTGFQIFHFGGQGVIALLQAGIVGRLGMDPFFQFSGLSPASIPQPKFALQEKQDYPE